jgi:hypothetical protein
MNLTQQDAHTLLSHLINANIVIWLIGLALYIYRTRIHNQKETNHARSTTRPNRRPIKTHTVTDLTDEISAAQSAVNPPHHPTAPSPQRSDGEGWGGVIFPEVG